MKKFLYTLLALLLIGLLTTYLILFTEWGNKIIASYIEKKINPNEHYLSVKTFKLRFNSLDFEAQANDDSTLILKGDFSLLKQSVNLNYHIDIKNLRSFKEWIPYPLRGAIVTSGNIKGHRKALVVQGVSNVAQSHTTYNALLDDFKLSHLSLNAQDANLEDLLYLINRPAYANAKVSLQADFNSLKPLEGHLILTANNALINNALINQIFHLNLKDTLVFNLSHSSDFKGNKAISDTTLTSPLVNFTALKSEYLFSVLKLNAPYTLEIPNLAKLYTNHPLKGSLTLKGAIEQSPKLLKVSGHSNLLDGALDFTLLNKDLKGRFSNISTLKALDLLHYPKFFQSIADANLDYDFIAKQGVLKARLKNARFLKNSFSDFLYSISKFDITKEIYNDANLISQINQQRLLSDLSLKSPKTQLKIHNGLLDLNTKQMDMLMDAEILKFVFKMKLQGNMHQPKFSLILNEKAIQQNLQQGLKEILKNDTIKKGLDHLLKDDKLKEKLEKGLKGLF
ncbi:hypothetical protein C2R96_05555 [Helicobacter pylori]|uniref:hypothetical protein n=1 Tax=Helicobacter pylori TaxID=210 RepID=UPI000D3C0680|nr:hypothetical protein [Helicobacter pylori]PUD31127.1 hypothetical protein C2R96_05555 [Helicobacter pylori]WQX14729.1 hypothetical protein E5P70_05310 [Helicobacter pylori]